MPNTKPTTIQPKPDDGRASHKAAHGALSTMLMDEALPSDVREHVANARNALEAHAMKPPAPSQNDASGVPLGESVAASKRRANGEDPEAKEDDEPEGDNAPKMSGKPNPLSLAKRWAGTPTDDDEPETAKPKPKAAATLAKGKPRFLGRGR